MFIALSATAACILLFFVWLLQDGAKNALHWPRHTLAGILLGIPVLFFSAWHGSLMLEPSMEHFPPPLWGLMLRHLWIWILFPIATFACSFFLDFLFARALGGACILLANALITLGFAQQVLCRPVYSIFALFLGIGGLFLLGLPWQMRDLLLWSSQSARRKRTLCLLFLTGAAIFLCFPIFS